MFKSIFTTNSNNTPDNICLFKNSTNSLKAGKLLYFKIDSDKSEDITFEIYVNQSITSNGTLVTTKKLDTYYSDTNSILFYRNPVVVLNIPVRKFLLSSNTKEFSTNLPVEQLDPGQSILVRKITKSLGKLTITLTWEEYNY